MPRATLRSSGLALALAASIPVGAAEPRARLDVTPREATVGDPLEATLVVELPAGTSLERRDLGPELGPFHVLASVWEGPRESAGLETWVWRGRIAAYETGDLEVPPVELTAVARDGASTVRTGPVAISIRSVLPPEGEPELADLKPPVSLPPDYTALRRALLVLASLLGAAAVAWWGGKRLASRLAAVPAELDPFRRLPPHQWAYAELKRLLEDRSSEESGDVAALFEGLSHVIKRYLGARFRVGLLERTTGEVAPALRQAGLGEPCLGEVRRLLDLCDRVKFARERPAQADCRVAIEIAYRIVDATRPAEEPLPARRQGAA